MQQVGNRGSEGQKLRLALEREGDPYDLVLLIGEAARIADRLSRLDAILSGETETWARIVNGREGTLEIKMDSALSEARQQVTVLRHLLAEIQRRRADSGAPAEEDDDLAGL